MSSIIASLAVAVVISPLDDMAVATVALVYVESQIARALLMPLVYCGIIVWYLNRRWS